MRRKGLTSLEVEVESVPYRLGPEELGNQTLSGPGQRNSGRPAACPNGCSQVPPTPAGSTDDAKGPLAQESEEGKLGGRGPPTFHPHPIVGVRLDCSHFEETEGQIGQGPGPASPREPSLTLKAFSPQEAMLSLGSPLPRDPRLPVFQFQSSSSVLSRRPGFP